MSQKPSWLQPHGSPWAAGAPRRLYANPWIALDEYDAVAPTGRKAVYGVVKFQNLALAVLPLHEDGTITLVGQNRFPHRDYSWEIPEGGGPLGEDPLDGAKRELREEAGLAAAAWRQVPRRDRSGRNRGPGRGARALRRGAERRPCRTYSRYAHGGDAAARLPYVS